MRSIQSGTEYLEYVDEISKEASRLIVERGITNDVKARELIDDLVSDFQTKGVLSEHVEELKRISEFVFGRLRGSLGAISHLLQDDSVNEIMINGPDKGFIERKDAIESIGRSFASEKELEQVIRRIATSSRREINELSPILDARLPDGSRVNAVLKNVALDGPVLTIRKFRHEKITMDEMTANGSLTPEAANTLRILVSGGMNIFVSGGTSSGKTTFLNALADYIPRNERVITIEDSAELKLGDIENLVRMECRNANVTGRGTVNMAMLIKSSLRMRPDRIIVGEVRGEEVSDMLQALNTGHSGMSTGHGNTVQGMLRRLEAMYIMGAEMPMDAIRAQIIEGIDIMVHVARLSDGSRRVLEISEVIGYEKDGYILNKLYVTDDNMKIVKKARGLKNDVKLKLRGLIYE
ncbi:MAG: CpaF family protein [Firmicutes bacterium]|nr:CpaF family protein [Bacillota bacterium]